MQCKDIPDRPVLEFLAGLKWQVGELVRRQVREQRDARHASWDAGEAGLREDGSDDQAWDRGWLSLRMSRRLRADRQRSRSSERS